MPIKHLPSLASVWLTLWFRFQSDTCPLWQVHRVTLKVFRYLLSHGWAVPTCTVSNLHIGKEIFLHHNQEQIATRYDGFDVPLGDTVVIRMVFHFVWQQLQENFSLSMVKMAMTYFLKCSGGTYHVSDALC